MNQMNKLEDIVKIGFIKRAQTRKVPLDLLEVLVKRAGTGDLLSAAINKLQSVGQGAGDFVKGIDTNNTGDAWKTSLLGALGGAGVGGLSTAFGNIGKREEDKGSILGSAAQGGLMGGLGGYALPHLKGMFQPQQPAQSAAPQQQQPPTVNVAAPNVNVDNAPPEEYRPDLATLKQNDMAPFKTRGNLTSSMLSTLPGGAALNAMSVDPEARTFGNAFSNFNNFVTLPAAGTAAGVLAGRGAGAKAIAGGVGNWVGNQIGSSRYRADQADKFTNLAGTFTPESLLENKNISTQLRQQLAEALSTGNPSRISDAVGSLSATTAPQQIPTQFKMVQDAVADQNIPGWYESPSMLSNIGNIFRKQ